MFSVPRVNVIESSEAFSVEVLDRTGMKYNEGQRSLHLYFEFLSEPGIAIWARTIERWGSPFESEQITESDRKRIVDNIVRAFQSQGERLVVQW
jgi:hypothetical protein